MAKRLGHSERVARFYQQRWPNYRTVIKLFGGWNQAIEASGLKPRPRGGRPGPAKRAETGAADERAERCRRKGISSEEAVVPGLRRPLPLLQRLSLGR
jgi:hypothetical protein